VATGCLAILAVLVAVIVVGSVIYWAVKPKDVTYDDVLTPQNATTFAQHNADWDHDDPNNVQYVQQAMSALGPKAYGMKFGALMDWERAHASQARAKLAGNGKAPAEYSDILTRQNINTFENNNDNWNSDDPQNVIYVKRAIARLGDKAYGRTFGDLMDYEKDADKPANSDVMLLQGTSATLNSSVDCFDSKTALEAENEAFRINDNAGAAQISTAHSGTLNAQTDVVILNHDELRDEVEVRAQSGTEAGAACWTTETYLKPRLYRIKNP